MVICLVERFIIIMAETFRGRPRTIHDTEDPLPPGGKYIQDNSIIYLSQDEQTIELTFADGLMYSKADTGDMLLDFFLDLDYGGRWSYWGKLYYGNTRELFEIRGEFQCPDSDRIVMPWDLLMPKMGRVPRQQRDERLAICHACDSLVHGVCLQCGCVMAAKTTLANASCPLNLW
jgi:hypothetical protein